MQLDNSERDSGVVLPWEGSCVLLEQWGQCKEVGQINSWADICQGYKVCICKKLGQRYDSEAIRQWNIGTVKHLRDSKAVQKWDIGAVKQCDTEAVQQEKHWGCGTVR